MLVNVFQRGSAMNNRILTALYRMGCPVPDALQRRLQLRTVQPGQIVCLQNCPVTEMMLLVHGELLIEAQFASGDSLIFTAENGISVMGDMELLSGRMVYASTVRAKTSVELLLLTVADFQTWMDEEPMFLKMVVRSLAEKCYRQSRDQGVLAYVPPSQRIARFLTEEKLRSPTTDGAVHCSHAELAQHTGMSERTVNRVLSELRECGAIHTEYGKVFLDEAMLRKIIAE